MAQKYGLQDNSQVQTLTLLSLPKVGGHHHVARFGAGNQDLANQDRKGRLEEYHKMTNDRRK